MFTKDDLKEGMVVDLKNIKRWEIKEDLGSYKLYLHKTPFLNIPLTQYRKDLSYIGDRGLDIVKVWQPEKLIWEREEIPEGFKGYGKDDFGERIWVFDECDCGKPKKGCEGHLEGFKCYLTNKFICRDCYDKLPETSGPKLPVNEVNRYKVRLLRKIKKEILKEENGIYHNLTYGLGRAKRIIKEKK